MKSVFSHFSLLNTKQWNISNIYILKVSLVVIMIFTTSCQQEVDDKLEQNGQHDLYMLGRAMKSFDFTRPIERNDFKNFFDKELGEKEGTKILDDISTIPSFSFLSNNIGHSQSRIDTDEFIDQANLSTEASEFVERIQTLFDSSDDTRIDFYNETVDKLEAVKVEIESTDVLNESDRQALLLSCEMLTVNLNDLLTLSEELFQESNSAGRCRWLCRAWRKVRSVVTGVVVGALVGRVFGPEGSVIGAITGFVITTVDTLGNNICHGALQCPSFKQNCKTGKCVK